MVHLGKDAVNMIVSGFCKDVFKKLPMEFAVEAQKLSGVNLEEVWDSLWLLAQCKQGIGWLHREKRQCIRQSRSAVERGVESRTGRKL